MNHNLCKELLIEILNTPFMKQHYSIQNLAKACRVSSISVEQWIDGKSVLDDTNYYTICTYFGFSSLEALEDIYIFDEQDEVKKYFYNYIKVLSKLPRLSNLGLKSVVDVINDNSMNDYKGYVKHEDSQVYKFKDTALYDLYSSFCENESKLNISLYENLNGFDGIILNEYWLRVLSLIFDDALKYSNKEDGYMKLGVVTAKNRCFIKLSFKSNNLELKLDENLSHSITYRGGYLSIEKNGEYLIYKLSAPLE